VTDFDPLLPGPPSRYARWLLDRAPAATSAVASAALWGALGGFGLTLLGASSSGAAAAALLGGVLGVATARSMGSDYQRIATAIARLDRDVHRGEGTRTLIAELDELSVLWGPRIGTRSGVVPVALAVAGALSECGRNAESARVLQRLSVFETTPSEWQLRCVLLAEARLALGDLAGARASVVALRQHPDAVVPAALDALLLACEGRARLALDRLGDDHANGPLGWRAYTAARALAHARAAEGRDGETRRALEMVQRWGGALALERLAMSQGPASPAAHAMLTQAGAYR
jgi:hypothetical protein